MYRTAYARNCHMVPATHGNRVYNLMNYHRDRILVPLVPQFLPYDDLRVDTCWAAALDHLFGEGSVDGVIQYLPGFIGSNDNVKFYYNRSSCQVWKLTRIR